MAGFCEAMINDGRLSPCFAESLMAALALIIAVGCYIVATLRLRSIHVVTTGVKVHRSRLAPLISLHALFVAVAQAIVIQQSRGAYFYCVTSGALAFAWLFYSAGSHKLNKTQSADGKMTTALLFSFCIVAVLNDLLIIVDRSISIASPRVTDPLVLKDMVTLDLLLVIFRLALDVWYVYSFLFEAQKDGFIRLPDAEQAQSSYELRRQNPNQSAFANLMSKLRKLMPFMWPRGDLKLQASILGCVLMLIVQRVLNVMLPLTYKAIVDALTPDSQGHVYFPVAAICIYVLVSFLQGGNGLAYTIQSTLWIPVEQFQTREVSIRIFQHLHSLSLRYHLHRETGAVLRTIDRGTSAISTLLQYIWFNIAPVLVDIAVAVVFFCYLFDIYFGIIVGTTMVIYIYVTVVITEWRTRFRREKNELENTANSIAVDSLLNFETVKYFGNEKFEADNYYKSILKFQKADWMNQISLRALNLSQNTVITLGLFAGGMLCARRVVEGTLNLGDFVLFMSYLMQLFGPLNWFGSYYRAINQSFVDMEKLLALFEESTEVYDMPGATELQVSAGHVVFENVSFAYDVNKPLSTSIHNLSFEIKPGQTVALVGESGAGKSSVLRLLFRFYDVTGGRILIDGQDIRFCTQNSLRKAIGVVPQDTNLFNQSIEYNIRYGRVDADDEAVRHAARMAQIHDKIEAFPAKYDTKVGERGLRLSGGELQRVAIARTLLKSPAIVAFDEATSSLDTQTERALQKNLAEMSVNRTSLVVAHRLSTIVDSDLILVMGGGTIIERGTHDQLLAAGGTYSSMWTAQSENKAGRARTESNAPAKSVVK